MGLRAGEGSGDKGRTAVGKRTGVRKGARRSGNPARREAERLFSGSVLGERMYAAPSTADRSAMQPGEVIAGHRRSTRSRNLQPPCTVPRLTSTFPSLRAARAHRSRGTRRTPDATAGLSTCSDSEIPTETHHKGPMPMRYGPGVCRSDARTWRSDPIVLTCDIDGFSQTFRLQFCDN